MIRDVELRFEELLNRLSDLVHLDDVYEEYNKEHGRIEYRRCLVSCQLSFLSQKNQWPGLKTIVMIEERQIRGGTVSFERRCFITNLPPDAKRIAEVVCAHWSIENGLHWILDVVFNEDRSRDRKDHAPMNMVVIRHVVLNMLNRAKPNFPKVSLKGLRKKAGWDDQILLNILAQAF